VEVTVGPITRNCVICGETFEPRHTETVHAENISRKNATSARRRSNRSRQLLASVPSCVGQTLRADSRRVAKIVKRGILASGRNTGTASGNRCRLGKYAGRSRLKLARIYDLTGCCERMRHVSICADFALGRALPLAALFVWPRLRFLSSSRAFRH
jgi:hypothetical protein